MGGATAHIELLAHGVQRYQAVALAVHRRAARPCRGGNPLVKICHRTRRNFPIIRNLIGCRPLGPVLEVEARVSVLGAEPVVRIAYAAASKQDAKGSGTGSAKARIGKVEGIIIDDEVAAHDVEQAAELGGAVGRDACVVGGESIRTVAVRIAADGDDRITPAVAQKAAGAVLGISVRANVHGEAVEGKTRDAHGFANTGSPLADRADEAADLRNLLAFAFGRYGSADFQTGYVERRGSLSGNATDCTADAGLPLGLAVCRDGGLRRSVVREIDRCRSRNAARNTADLQCIVAV